MCEEKRLKQIFEEKHPLGRAGAIAQDEKLKAFLISETGFLPDTASLTERLYAFNVGLDRVPLCTTCGVNPTAWNPKRQEYRLCCSPVCAAKAVPRKTIKQQQKLIEENFVYELDTCSFDPHYAASFLRNHCLRRDGQLNGNLTKNPRNFIRKFGQDEFNRVLSDFFANHRQENFSKWAYLLDREAARCNVCGGEASFDSYKDGFRSFCSAKCSNSSIQKVSTIREKLLAPSDEMIAERKARRRATFERAVREHRRIIEEEGEFLIQHCFEDSGGQTAEHRYRFSCITCHNQFESAFRNRRCYRCSPRQYTLESEVADKFRDFQPHVNKRSILTNGRKEIDIWFEEQRVAVELDGLFWHSFAENDPDEQSKRLAHYEKRKDCENHNINLLAIRENEWRDNTKQKICLSMISARLKNLEKIGARSCKVVRLAPDEADEFFSTNHLEGACSASVTYGLDLNGTVVAAMSFDLKEVWYALCYASKTELVVVGGASRLLAHFQRNSGATVVRTTSDLRMDSGNLCSKLGFVKISDHAPEPFWTDCYQIHENVKDGFSRGLRRTWSYGSATYEKRFP